MPDQLTGEVTELLQALIRNECVNDGSVASGHEDRSAEVLAQVLDGPGIDLQRYEPEPGRTSLVARIEGSDPDGPIPAAHGPHRRGAGQPRALAP